MLFFPEKPSLIRKNSSRKEMVLLKLHGCLSLVLRTSLLENSHVKWNGALSNYSLICLELAVSGWFPYSDR